MNDKIRNHINIIFAAAPKTTKATEMKEELLINLNDRYEDLLKSGYDSTSAFHIAISGIGDIDELFEACRDAGTTMLHERSASHEGGTNRDATAKQLTKWIPILLAVIVGLIILRHWGYEASHYSEWRVYGMTIVYACWAIGIGLVVYVLTWVIQNRIPSDTSSFPNEPATQPGDVSWQASEISNKRIAAGILAILLGTLGVHKFYLGYTGAGLIMLLVTVLSIFILSPVTGTIGLIEGIIYLAKSDREFYRDYIVQKRTWF